MKPIKSAYMVRELDNDFKIQIEHFNTYAIYYHLISMAHSRTSSSFRQYDMVFYSLFSGNGL